MHSIINIVEVLCIFTSTLVIDIINYYEYALYLLEIYTLCFNPE